MANLIQTFMHRLGVRKISEWFLDYIDIFAIPFVSIYAYLRNFRKGRRLFFQSFMKQIYFTGVKGIFSVSILGVVIGLVVGLVVGILEDQSQGFIDLVLPGWQSVFMVLIVLKLFGPLLVMLIIVARTGSAITIEIAHMKVNYEIEAIDIMGIDVYHFIFAPRLLGITLALVCLFVFFILISSITNLFYFVFVQGVYWLDFIDTFFESIRVMDLTYDLIYMLGFGFVITSVSCFHGLKVQRSAREIPNLNTKSVVRSLILCLLYYGLITLVAIEAGGWFELNL